MAGLVPQLAAHPAQLMNIVRVGGIVALVAGVAIRRYRTRRALRKLEAHRHQDIGLTKAEVEREVAKPFWRA